MTVTVSSYKNLLQSLAIKKGTRPGLGRVKALDQELGFPSRAFRTVHVAGTNGKGTVTTKIAFGLTALGLKVGLYTSPHISSFRERIQINGIMIPPEKLEEHLLSVLNLSQEVTFFEAMTLTAFLYFAEEKVDYAIIETGLGGKWDPTNIILPKLSVLTSITLDHTDILGKTIDEIAENKAGVIKQETPVVVSARAMHQPVFKRAFQVKAPLYLLPKVDDWMEENTKIAASALSILCPGVENFSLSALPPCRFERGVFDGVELLFDIAHNPDGLTKLFQRIDKLFPDRGLSLIFAISQNKDVETAALIVSARTPHLYLYESPLARIVRADEARRLLPQAWDGDFDAFFADVKERGDLLVITGSAYIMADWKKRFGIELITD